MEDSAHQASLLEDNGPQQGEHGGFLWVEGYDFTIPSIVPGVKRLITPHKRKLHKRSMFLGEVTGFVSFVFQPRAPLLLQGKSVSALGQNALAIVIWLFDSPQKLQSRIHAHWLSLLFLSFVSFSSQVRF